MTRYEGRYARQANSRHTSDEATGARPTVGGRLCDVLEYIFNSSMALMGGVLSI